VVGVEVRELLADHELRLPLHEKVRDVADKGVVLPARSGARGDREQGAGRQVSVSGDALAGDADVALDGFLLPGHVSVVAGWKSFAFLAEEYGLPSVVVGFTPTDVLRGVLELIAQHVEGRAEVTNLYSRAVTADGNPAARALLDRFFEPATVAWRGLGEIPGSGLALREPYRRRDAETIPVEVPEPVEPVGCRCGEVLKGTIDPPECPLFGRTCTPDHAVGACMVSSEGTCAAWYRHEGVRPR